MSCLVNRRILAALILLCSLGWSSDFQKRSIELRKLGEKCQAGEQKSCQKLAEIAVADPSVAARLAAVRAIADQAVFAQIVKSDSNGRVREAAASRLKDQGLLATVAATDADAGVRVAAVEKLNDESAIAQRAKNDPDPQVRVAAVKQLHDQSVLAQVAKNDKDPAVGAAAVEVLTDQALLMEIARDNPNPRMREAAVRNPYLLDAATFAAVAQTDPTWFLRLEAVTRLDDQAILNKVIETDLAGLPPEVRTDFPLVIREARIRRLALVAPREQFEQGAVLASLDSDLAIQVDGTPSRFPVPVAEGRHSVTIMPARQINSVECTPACLGGCQACFEGNAQLRIGSSGISASFSFQAEKGALYIVSIEERKGPRTLAGFADPTRTSYVLVFESRGTHPTPRHHR